MLNIIYKKNNIYYIPYKVIKKDSDKLKNINNKKIENFDRKKDEISNINKENIIKSESQKESKKNEIKNIINMNNSINIEEIFIRERTKNKLRRKLIKDKVEYIIAENNIDIDYKKFNGSIIIKYMLPEVVRMAKDEIKTKSDEIYLCTQKYSTEIENIIRDLTKYVKVVNIISNNKRYKILEGQLEKEDTIITVINNKRKSLKNADIVINLDFKNFKDYNMNRKLIIIDLTQNLENISGFEGKIIKKIDTTTNKVTRIIGENENCNKSELIEADLCIKCQEYNEARKYIYANKISILS